MFARFWHSVIIPKYRNHVQISSGRGVWATTCIRTEQVCTELHRGVTERHGEFAVAHWRSPCLSVTAQCSSVTSLQVCIFKGRWSTMAHTAIPTTAQSSPSQRRGGGNPHLQPLEDVLVRPCRARPPPRLAETGDGARAGGVDRSSTMWKYGARRDGSPGARRGR